MKKLPVVYSEYLTTVRTFCWKE